MNDDKKETWKKSIDSTLRTTAATLQKLEERHANYVVAKQRAYDALPGMGNPCGGSSRQRSQVRSADRSAIEAMPPPLPASYMTALTAQEMQSALALCQSQIKNLSVELELERNIRADSTRELAARHQTQVAELRSQIYQLTDENTYLKQSVKALEARPSQTHTAQSVADAELLGAKAALLSRNYGGTASRLEEVEAGLARLRRQVDDRHARADAALREMVSAKVEVEVEHMRSIARDAARGSVEELIKLRVAAVQTMFSNELHKVLESTGVANEVARTVDDKFRLMERDLTRRTASLEDRLEGVQSTLENQSRIDVVEALRKSEERAHSIERELTALRQEMHTAESRQTQLLDTKVEAARLDSANAASRMLTERLESGQYVRAADVGRMVDEALAPALSLRESVTKSLKSLRDDLGEVQRSTLERVLAAEEAQRNGMADVDRCTQHTEFARKTAERLAADVEKLKTQQRHVAEDVEAADRHAAGAMEAVEQLRLSSTERVSAIEAQQRKLRDDVFNAQRTAAADAQEKVRAAEERAQAAEQLATTLQTTTIPQAVQSLTGRHEALHQYVHGTCAPTLDALQSFRDDTSAKLLQLSGAVGYNEKLLAKATADSRAAVDAGVADARKALEQGLEDAKAAQSRETATLRGRLDKCESDVSRAIASLHDPELCVTKAAAEQLVKGAVSGLVLGRLQSVEDAVANLATNQRTAPDTPIKQRDAAMANASAALESSLRKQFDTLSAEVSELRAAAGRATGDASGLARELKSAIQQQTELIDGIDTRLAQVERSVQEVRRDAAAKLQQQSSHLGERIELLSGRVEDVAAEANNALQAALERFKTQTLAPSRLASALAADPGSAQTLAHALQPLLDVSPSVTQQLAEQAADLRRAEKQAADAVNSCKDLAKLLADVQEESRRTADALASAEAAHQRDKEEEKEEEEERKKVNEQQGTPDIHPTGDARPAEKDTLTHEVMEQYVGAAVAKVESGITRASEAAAGRLEVLERATERLNEEVPTLQRTLGAAERAVRSLEEWQTRVPQLWDERCNAAVQEADTNAEIRVRAVVNRLKAVEEAIDGLHQETVKAARSVSQLGKDMDGKLRQSQDEEIQTLINLENTFKRKLEDLRTQLTENCEASQSAWRAQAAELSRTKCSVSSRDQLQQRVDDLEERLELVQHRAAAPTSAAVPPAAQTGAVETDTDDTAAAATMARELQARLGEVEDRMSVLESQSGEAVEATADTIGSLHDILRQCVERVSGELRRSPSLLACGDKPGSGDALHGGGGGRAERHVETLDDIFVSFLHQIGHTQHAIETLRVNALETLELVQQHEMDLSGLPAVRDAVTKLSTTLQDTVAPSLRLDPTAFKVDVSAPCLEGNDGDTGDGAESERAAITDGQRPL